MSIFTALQRAPTSQEQQGLKLLCAQLERSPLSSHAQFLACFEIGGQSFEALLLTPCAMVLFSLPHEADNPARDSAPTQDEASSLLPAKARALSEFLGQGSLALSVQAPESLPSLNDNHGQTVKVPSALGCCQRPFLCVSLTAVSSLYPPNHASLPLYLCPGEQALAGLEMIQAQLHGTDYSATAEKREGDLRPWLCAAVALRFVLLGFKSQGSAQFTAQDRGEEFALYQGAVLPASLGELYEELKQRPGPWLSLPSGGLWGRLLKGKEPSLLKRLCAVLVSPPDPGPLLSVLDTLQAEVQSRLTELGASEDGLADHPLSQGDPLTHESTVLCSLLALLRYFGVQDEQAVLKLAQQCDLKGAPPILLTLLGELYFSRRENEDCFKRSLLCHREAAAAGQPHSLFRLGLMCFYGLYTERNYAHAYEFISKAAFLGLGVACYYQAVMLKQGLGVKPDDKQALQKLREALARGYLPAFELSWRYLKGTGLRRDEREALKILRQGAALGSAPCAWALGEYLESKGGQRALKQALPWYRKAASADLGDALHRLGCLYLEGDGGLKRDLSQAASCFERGHRALSWQCSLMLGLCLFEGLGVAQDRKAAFELWMTLALKGHARAQHNVAYCLENAQGTDLQGEEALSWYERAAQSGLSAAWHRLGNLYEQGRLLTQNPARAFDCYVQALLLGNTYAAVDLGSMSLPQAGACPPLIAAALYEHSAQSGCSEGLVREALLLQQGAEGLTADPDRSRKLLKQAAALGDAEAQHYLSEEEDSAKERGARQAQG